MSHCCLQADKQGHTHVVVVGSTELERNAFTVKKLSTGMRACLFISRLTFFAGDQTSVPGGNEGIVQFLRAAHNLGALG